MCFKFLIFLIAKYLLKQTFNHSKKLVFILKNLKTAKFTKIKLKYAFKHQRFIFFQILFQTSKIILCL